MNLIILRHGEAGNRTADPMEDSGRELNNKGKKETRLVAKALKSMNASVEQVATSPLKRAMETAEIVAGEFGLEKKIELWDELKPEADSPALLDRLMKLEEDTTVLLVGHEPSLSTLISLLVSGKKTSRISLKKAGAAKVSINDISPKPTGELKWLLTPKQMKKLS